MTLDVEISGGDLKAARLLAGLTLDQLAGITGLNRVTISHMEDGRRRQERTFFRIADALAERGITFHALDGWAHLITDRMDRRAPTPALVGTLTGPRLRRARERLKLSQMDLASRAGTSVANVRRVEGLASLASGVAERIWVAQFLGLESAGYRFGKNWNDDRIVPPDSPAAPPAEPFVGGPDPFLELADEETPEDLEAIAKTATGRRMAQT